MSVQLWVCDTCPKKSNCQGEQAEAPGNGNQQRGGEERETEIEGRIVPVTSPLEADGKCYFVFHFRGGRQHNETLSYSLATGWKSEWAVADFL